MNMTKDKKKVVPCKEYHPICIHWYTTVIGPDPLWMICKGVCEYNTNILLHKKKSLMNQYWHDFRVHPKLVNCCIFHLLKDTY